MTLNGWYAKKTNETKSNEYSKFDWVINLLPFSANKIKLFYREISICLCLFWSQPILLK